MGLFWPEAVFKHDFAVPDRGRPLSKLSINTWHHYIANQQGWRSLARELIPEEFEANADEAANKVRKAARSFMRFNDSVWEAMCPANDEQGNRLDELLGHEGLEALAATVVERKFMDALSEPDPPPAKRRRRRH